MASLEELRVNRENKLKILKDHGIDPFPAKVERDMSLSDVKKDFLSLETSKKDISLVGRIMAKRGQGAILFLVLYDGTARFQAVLKKDILGEENMKLFSDVIDIGDFLSVKGNIFKTERGEESILVKSWSIVTKSLLPLPEKWHGLKDDDERYRKRYLDILMNQDLKEILLKKAKFWDVTRSFMKEHGFVEVDTPTLELTTGGAEATPFKTHINDYDMDMYLRISVGELWQKRLMSAGFEKTFEIGRVFRNEGSSPDHLQEFTNLEFYMAYADYRDGMRLVRELYNKIALEVFGKTEFTTRGHTFDLAKEWKEIDYVSEIRSQTGIDILIHGEKEMKDKLNSLKVNYSGENKERLIDSLWKYCRKNISGPAFLINHPTIVAPLAKSNKDGKSVQMFQPIIGGSEMGRGYSELNDPIDQKQRFEIQRKLLEGGDSEAMMPDFEFVEMLEYGMPPTCGYGFGERFFAFLADLPVREVQYFPLMRPKNS